MKKILATIIGFSAFVCILLTLSKPLYPAVYGRRVDRDWSVQQGNVSAGASRITFNQAGALWIQVVGADCYIDFNATANADSIKIANGTSIDFFPANVNYDEYATIYSAGTATYNYILTD